MVFIVIPIGPKLAVAQSLVKSDSCGVIFPHFQPHDNPVRFNRNGLALAHELLSQPVAAFCIGYCNRIDARQSCRLVHQHQAVSHERAVAFSHDHPILGQVDKPSETAPGNTIFRKAAIFQSDQCIQIVGYGKT